MRMDAGLAHVDAAAVQVERDRRRLQLRRIDAELGDTPLQRIAQDPPDLFAATLAQWQARRQHHRDTLGEARQQEARARHELVAAHAVLVKLQQSVPMLREQATSYARLGGGGFFPALQVQDKQREYQERAQDLAAQQASVQGLEATLDQARQRIEQVHSAYRSALQDERADADMQLQRLLAEKKRLDHKAAWLELRAPQAGIIKTLATHTPGTVVTPGAILATLVPADEALVAEVQVRNADIGFVQVGQAVRLKLAAYPFQKYGLVDGKVRHLGADAEDGTANLRTAGAGGAASDSGGARRYKALIALERQWLATRAAPLPLAAGMQVVAEIHQGKRTPLEYLLAPVQGALHDSARER